MSPAQTGHITGQMGRVPGTDGTHTRVDNPRPSYKAENPANPKIGRKDQPDIQIPPTAGHRKKTPKIPDKYPKNTNSRIFLVFQGVFEGVFRGVSCFVCWGVFLHFVGFPIL